MEKAQLRLQVLGETISLEVDRLQPAARIDEALPALRAIEDRLVQIAIARHGQPVSCSKGCAACCRIQPVPVTPAEAYSLIRMLEGFDEPSRDKILARFAEVESRLKSAGVRDAYLEGRRPVTEEEGKASAQTYLDLRLACPFLEDDDSCGIYDERPLACREYYVTSPPAYCGDPLCGQVRPVPPVASLIDPALRAASAIAGRVEFAIPLTLAAAYVQIHREELERTYSGAEVFSGHIRAVISEDNRVGPATLRDR